MGSRNSAGIAEKGIQVVNDIVRHDQFMNLRQTMGRLFDEGTLPVDISEQEGELLVKASLTWFEAEDIVVQVDESVLSIKAKHSEEHKEHGERFCRRERSFGSVCRRIALSGIVHDAEVETELKNGVPALHIPLPEKPKQIEIKNGD
jgi:HSP20 family molecular chaperone IbpA